jgi:hypothetical protein
MAGEEAGQAVSKRSQEPGTAPQPQLGQEEISSQAGDEGMEGNLQLEDAGRNPAKKNGQCGRYQAAISVFARIGYSEKR